MVNRILLLEANRAILQNPKNIFHSLTRTFEIKRINDVEAMIPALESEQFDLIVINDVYDKERTLAEQIKRKFPHLTILYNWELIEKNFDLGKSSSEDYDVLTRVFNKNTFTRLLNRCMETVKRTKNEIFLLYIDINNFNAINEEYGHSIGDKLLSHAAFRAQACLRFDDILGRIDGDEFAIILNNVNEKSDAGTVAEKLLSTLHLPYLINNKQYKISVNIGIACFPDDANSADQLLKNSATALEIAKKSSGSDFHYFSDAMDEDRKSQLRLEVQLPISFKDREFYLEYQPIMKFPENKIVGYEALLRWNNSEFSSISPLSVIAAAEKSDLIHDIGKWIIDCGMQVFANRLDASPDLYLAFNLSPIQLRPSFFKFVEKKLWQYRIDKTQIKFEISEQNMAEAGIPAETLNQFADYGLQLGLDDFGTHKSNIADLLDLPLAYIKIDSSFIDDLKDSRKMNKLHAVLEITRLLGIDAIAKGIESESQKQALIKKRCFFGQGFYLGYPQPIKCT